MNLTGTSDKVRLATSSTSAIDVQSSWVDKATGMTPGRTNVAISTATTTDLIGSPASGDERIVRAISMRNKGGASNTLTLIHTDGTTAVEVWEGTLQPNETAIYDGRTVKVFGVDGGERSTVTAGQLSPTVNTLNTVVLGSDQTNNNGTANTLQDVTGLSFSVNSGETYWFRFVVDYTAAATTTGSRWTLNTPSTTRLAYRSQYSLTATSDSFNNAVAVGIPAASNATSANTTGNIAVVEGFITPSASGTVQLRFASEVSASAIVAKAGSILQWLRVV